MCGAVYKLAKEIQNTYILFCFLLKLGIMYIGTCIGVSRKILKFTNKMYRGIPMFHKNGICFKSSSIYRV
jgi:hypothetical protein